MSQQDDRNKNESEENFTFDFNLEGFLGQFGDLSKMAARLNDLLEQAEGLSGEQNYTDRSGRIRTQTEWRMNTLDQYASRSSRPPMRPSSIPRQRPTRPVSTPKSNTPQRPVKDVSRDPLVDIMDEVSHLLVIVELAGVLSEEDIQLDLQTDRLQIKVANNAAYDLSVELPRTVTKIKSQRLNNGILEIRLT